MLRLQRAAGNRVVAQLVLARAPGSGAKGAQAVRKIVLDANVFDQLARGNVDAANTLRELALKNDVYVSWQGFEERVVKTTVRTQASAAKRIIEELRIKMAPPAPKAVLDELVAKNSYKWGERTATILSDAKDVRVAADAKALDAEVWSFDGAFKNGAVQKTLGVKVAPETKDIKFVSAKPDQSRALRILGIREEPVAGELPAGGGGHPQEPAGGTERVPDEPTVVAERVGEDAAADLAEKAAGTAAEGLTFAETVGAAFEAISPVLDVLFLAQAGYALGKALLFHNPAEMDPEQMKLMHLMETNVMPAAFKVLKTYEPEARRLALRAPELDVYAKVTMTLTYGADGHVSMDKNTRMVYDDERLEDAQFNFVSVGYDSATAKKDGGETHHYADWKDHRRRMQIVTFPILLNPLGQSRGLRRWVAMRDNAAYAIKRGLSARSIAEGTHWVGELGVHMGPGDYDWTYLDEREEARRKKAMAPSHRAEVVLAAKVAFTEAYIDAASDHMDQPAVKKLYDDAVRYYDELKRTTIDPEGWQCQMCGTKQSKPLLFGGDLTPADRRALEGYMKSR